MQPTCLPGQALQTLAQLPEVAAPMRALGLPAYVHAGNLLRPPRPQRPATAPPTLAAQVGVVSRSRLTVTIQLPAPGRPRSPPRWVFCTGLFEGLSLFPSCCGSCIRIACACCPGCCCK